MKKTAFIWGLALLVLAGCNQKKTVEMTTLGMWTDYYLIPTLLKGKVKEMKEINYWAVEKDGRIEKGVLMKRKDLDSIGSTPNMSVSFDEKGTPVKIDHLDGMDIFQSRIATIENGKLKRWDYKIKDSISYYVVPAYDNVGNLTGAAGYRPLVDTLVNKIIITGDVNSKTSKYEYFNQKNTLTGYHVCSLDSEGHILEAKYFNKSDSLMSVLTNIYDKNGSIIKQVTVIEKPKSTSVWDYKDLKLDEHGNVIEYYSSIDNGKYKIFTERTFVYY
jgi:hypothetical protein